MKLTEEQICKFAESSYKGTMMVTDFLEQEINAVLLSQVSPWEFEEILSGLYCRLFLFARSLSALADAQHFQTVRTTARTALAPSAGSSAGSDLVSIEN
jgi:hypothetical protein